MRETLMKSDYKIIERGLSVTVSEPKRSIYVTQIKPVQASHAAH